MKDIIAFTKTKLPFGWLGNMSPFPITFLDVEWRTTEALFQALRFNDAEIQNMIRAEKSPMGVKFLAKSHADKMVVQQLSQRDVMNMRICLLLKLKFHPHLKEELIATDDAKIIEDVTSRGNKGSNLFWGMRLVDGEWEGQNVLGNLWMEIREEIKLM